MLKKRFIYAIYNIYNQSFIAKFLTCKDKINFDMFYKILKKKFYFEKNVENNSSVCGKGKRLFQFLFYFSTNIEQQIQNAQIGFEAPFVGKDLRVAGQAVGS